MTYKEERKKRIIGILIRLLFVYLPLNVYMYNYKQGPLILLLSTIAFFDILSSINSCPRKFSWLKIKKIKGDDSGWLLNVEYDVYINGNIIIGERLEFIDDFSPFKLTGGSLSEIVMAKSTGDKKIVIDTLFSRYVVEIIKSKSGISIIG